MIWVVMKLTQMQQSFRKRATKRKLPKKQGAAMVAVRPELTGKYDNDPYFQEKVNRANHIVETFGIPKFPETPEQR